MTLVIVSASLSFSKEFKIFTNVTKQMTRVKMDRNRRINPMVESDNPVSANT